MKGSLVLAMAGMANAYAAHSHRHAHELFRRGEKAEVETCVPTCTTVYETIYGEPTLYYPHPKPTEAAPCPTCHGGAEPYDKPAPAPSAPAVPAPPAPPAAEPEKPQGPPPKGLGGHGKNTWAITYSPYTEDAGVCKTREEVFADIKRIKSFGMTHVRVYSTDCSTLENVGDACEQEGLLMIVGVFVKEAGCGYSGVHKEQAEKLAEWGKTHWHLVSLVVIGNEACFSGLCNGSQLRQLIITVKGICTGAGYTGPYTTAETTNIWQQYGGDLCDLVDIVGANIHPYFNAGISAGEAGPFVAQQLQMVRDICGKEAFSLETGWPSAGKGNGKADANPGAQKQAIDSIRGTCGESVVLFTYGLAMWKSHDTDCACEPYFDTDKALA